MAHQSPALPGHAGRAFFAGHKNSTKESDMTAETAVKERPIIFTGEMVRAILDGRKTQTRRAVKPAPKMVKISERSTAPWDGDPATLKKLLDENKRGCPYGQPGDRLWVRETHGYEIRSVGGTPHEQIAYRASNPESVRCYDCNGVAQPMKWRPSIHMPRWASRILLEVVSVRVERLQEISEADAKTEGLSELSKDGNLYKFGIPDREGFPGTDDHGWPWVDWKHNARNAFWQLWESINGAGSWDENPFVWVVTFKRIPQ